MNTFVKVSSIIGGLVLLVALVAISGVYRVGPLSADHGVSAQVTSDYVSNDVAASVLNTVTTTIIDAGRNMNSGRVEDIPATDITVTNLTTGVSINVSSTETGVDTHVFKRAFDVTATTTTTTPPQIAASDGDQIQVTYCFVAGTSCGAGSTFADTPDFNSVIVVDAVGPTFGNESPVATSTSNNTTQVHQVNVGDSGIGVGDEDTDVRDRVTFTIRGTAQSAGPVTAIVHPDFQWQVARTSAGNPEGNLSWSVTAVDALGNSATTAVFLVEIDSLAPDLTAAITGDVADTSGAPVANDKATDDRTSIRLVFDDDIEGVTVNAGDFLAQSGGVEVGISSANWYADLPTFVYLTLDTALAADAEPTIQITSDIRDSADNPAALGDAVDASDGIAPGLSVGLTGTATDEVVTNGSLTIRVSADEDSTNPTQTGGQLIVRRVGADGSTPGQLVRAANGFSVEDDSNVWEWTFDFATDGTEDGLYNAEVTITDGTQAGTYGEASADDEDAIIFEVDTRIPAPSVNDVPPTISFSEDDPNTFINIGFSGEGDEYGYAADKDSHNTITSLTATVDGVAVSVNSIDDISFTIAAPAGGYSLGDHRLSLTATDEAGNTETFNDVDDQLVTIVARDEFSISLQPGYNLISLPGEPASSAINDVIPAGHAINQVLTYDPSLAGGWLVAERGDDGLFAGTLDAIDTTKALLVRTTTFEELGVLIPRVGAGEQTLPPIVSLTEGWNLVPVLDITGDLTAPATPVTIGDYFGGATIARVYTLDQFGKLVVPAAVDVAEFGRGYWVYVTADTVLVP